jgi:hypothetical protein
VHLAGMVTKCKNRTGPLRNNPIYLFELPLY